MFLSWTFLGVDSGFKEPFFWVVGFCFVVVWYWEAEFHDFFDIDFRGIEQLCNVSVLLHLVVALFLPTWGCCPVPLHHNEIGIQKQNNIVFHLFFIERYGYRLGILVVEGVGEKCGLDHGEAVDNWLSIEADSFEKWFVKTYSKSVDKMASS